MGRSEGDGILSAMEDLYVGSSRLNQRYESPCTDVSLPCLDGPIEFSESIAVDPD